jgi:hypothetical protein
MEFSELVSVKHTEIVSQMEFSELVSVKHTEIVSQMEFSELVSVKHSRRTKSENGAVCAMSDACERVVTQQDYGVFAGSVIGTHGD